MSMFRLARRRPSPALIVACCALFVALGGTSYAVAVGSIGSPQIRDGSVRGIDVKNRGLSGNDLRPDSVGGRVVKEETLDVSKLGTVPSADGVALRVRVDATGRETLAQGVDDVEHLSTGRYNVVFDRDVSACVPAATIIDDTAGQGAIMVRTNDGAADAVAVTTLDSAAALADRAFYLLVSC